MLFDGKTDLSNDNLNRLVAGDGKVQGLRVFGGRIEIDDKKAVIMGPSISGLKVVPVKEGNVEIKIKDAEKITYDNTTIWGESGGYINDGKLYGFHGNFIIVTSA